MSIHPKPQREEEDNASFPCTVNREASAWQILGLTAAAIAGPFIAAFMGPIAMLVCLCAEALAIIGYVSWRWAATAAIGEGALVLIGAGRPQRILVNDVKTSLANMRTGTLSLVLRDRRAMNLAFAPSDLPRVLHQWGLSLEARTLTLPLRGQIGSYMFGFLFFHGAMIAQIFLFEADELEFFLAKALLFPLSILLTVLVTKRWRNRSIQIGNEGVRIQKFFFSQFVPFGLIVDIASGFGGAVLRLKDGDERSLPTIESDAVIAAVRSGLRASAAQTRDELLLLNREERSIETWKATLTQSVQTFRGLASSRERFLSVLQDGKAAPEARIGAAIALRVGNRDDDACILQARETSIDREFQEALLEVYEDRLSETTMKKQRRL
jgi:hypothetical protein